MASNKSFISLPSSPKLGASSSPLIGGGTKLSAAPKLKKSSFSFRPVGTSSVVDTISAAPPGQANMEAISESLIETNRILVEIQNQLAMDFAYRIAKEKGELKQQRQEESRRKFSRREKGLEAFNGIAKSIVSVGKAVAKPFASIFGKIASILGILGAGIASNAFITWIRDEENQKKLKKFFNILTKNWKLIVGVIAAIGAGALIAKVIAFTTALSGLAAFLVNPYTLAAIGLLAATVFAMTAKSTSENLASIVGDDDDKRRKMIKGFEQMREMDDEKLKKVSGQEPRGFREELNKQIYFLKTGRPLLYDRNQKGLFPPSYREMADSATFRERLAFSKFEDKGARLQGMFEGPAFVQPIEQRELGGPGYKGRTYLTGERGPELITFPENGVVFNHTNTEKVYNMLTEGGKGKVEVYDMRTVKKKQERSVPKPTSMDKPVPELSPIKDNLERLKFMAAYGVA